MIYSVRKGVNRLRIELVQARKNRKITQIEMANLLGISRSFYSLIENGARNPDYGLAKKIAALFKVSPESIFFDLDGFELNQKKNIQSDES